jgi:hypothetical protein
LCADESVQAGIVLDRLQPLLGFGIVEETGEEGRANQYRSIQEVIDEGQVD